MRLMCMLVILQVVAGSGSASLEGVSGRWGALAGAERDVPGADAGWVATLEIRATSDALTVARDGRVGTASLVLDGEVVAAVQPTGGAVQARTGDERSRSSGSRR